MKTSSRPGAMEATPGADVSVPPRLSQPFRRVPSHHRWFSVLSTPRVKTSTRSADHETAAGSEVMPPEGAPRFSQGDQPVPARYVWCHRLLSVPLAKASRRPTAREEMAGRPVIPGDGRVWVTNGHQPRQR